MSNRKVEIKKAQSETLIKIILWIVIGAVIIASIVYILKRLNIV